MSCNTGRFCHKIKELLNYKLRPPVPQQHDPQIHQSALFVKKCCIKKFIILLNTMHEIAILGHNLLFFSWNNLVHLYLTLYLDK